MKIVFTLILLAFSLYAQTPFTLTKIAELYPLVEIHTDKVPQTYKAVFTKEIQEYAKELDISTKNYSQRTLAIIISRVAVGKSLVLKVRLLLGEEVKRIDDGEEVFAITYQKADIIEVDDLDEDLVDSVDYLLEEFKDQYIEDNKE